MSAPGDIRQYRADLEDALRVRLARRERILAEACAHLEEEASAAVAGGMDRGAAERYAVRVFGAPEEVAASHGTDGATTFGRVVVALADILYRLLHAGNWRPRLLTRVAGAAGLATVAIPLVASGRLPAWPLLLFTVGIMDLVPEIQRTCALPRPGYARRWMKLDRAVRARILDQITDGEALLAGSEDFTAEFAMRVRRLGMTWPMVALLAACATVACAWSGLTAVAFAGWATAAAVAGLKSRRSARQQAEGELAALDILDQVIREAKARVTLGERFCGGFYVEMRPIDRRANPLTLAADDKTIWVWANGEPHPFYGPKRLAQLRLCLASALAGNLQDESP